MEVNRDQNLLSQGNVGLGQEDKDMNKMSVQEDNAMTGSQEKVQLSGSEGMEGVGTQESDPNYFANQVGVVVADG